MVFATKIVDCFSPLSMLAIIFTFLTFCNSLFTITIDYCTCSVLYNVVGSFEVVLTVLNNTDSVLSRQFKKCCYACLVLVCRCTVLVIPGTYTVLIIKLSLYFEVNPIFVISLLY